MFRVFCSSDAIDLSAVAGLFSFSAQSGTFRTCPSSSSQPAGSSGFTGCLRSSPGGSLKPTRIF